MDKNTAGLNRLSATEAARLLARRELTAEALVRACLERIAEREAVVQAWVYLDEGQALEQARALDRGALRGLLHGLPVGVKDIFDTHDMPTQYGSPIYQGHRPAADASSVALTRRAGGVILGKTVTTEFATFSPNKTRNPHNPAHTPGGSSSGSAAGVADWMMPLAFGTQTVGSTIRPASYCGIVGYKPTYNLLQKSGVKPEADTLDTIGVFGRTVPDVALFAAGLTDLKNLQAGMDRPPRIGLCRTHEWNSVQPDMAAAFDSAGGRLAAAGAVVRDFSLPASFAGLLAAQQEILWYENARCFGDEYLRHPELLTPGLRERCAKGFARDPADYLKALHFSRVCRDKIDDALGDCDVLLAPAATGEAPKGLGSTGDPAMNAVWTVLHTPCVTVPVATGTNGLPLGLQAVGRIGDDGRTLACAQWVHERLGR
ncbi:MAG: amidase [Betaproteobacteria bacterium]|nr:amidase [Betaproteobacteria bacterium]